MFIMPSKRGASFTKSSTRSVMTGAGIGVGNDWALVTFIVMTGVGIGVGND